ncbi:MAG: ABC transporter ATP-binding protein [Flavobacteriales bacterium]|nr:ABC transporter ATP-binding protein [Flavobacteriales bacterium]
MPKDFVGKRPMERFWKLLKPDRKEIVNVYIYAIFSGLVYLTLPLGIQAIINLIQVGSINTSWVVLVTIVIAGVAVHGLLQIYQLKITENLQQKIFARAAFDFTYRIPRLKLEKIYKEYAPELMNRFFDILSVQKGLSKILIDFSTASVQILISLILLSLYHPFFVLFSLLLVIFLVVVFKWTGTRGLKTSLKESEYKYKVAYWLQEVARANVTFKLAGNSELPLDKTNHYVDGYIKEREKHFKVLLTQYSLMVVFKVLVALGLLVIGGILVVERQMNIGQFVAAEIIVLMIMGAVEKLIFTIEVIYDVLTSLEKLGQVTDIELETNEGQLLSIDQIEKGVGIEFEKVCFNYPGEAKPILTDISLEINKGEKVLIYSDNDQSARALLYLSAALYEPSNGVLLYNGLLGSNLDLSMLRSKTGDTLRKDMLFHGTILENITMNRPQVSIDEVLHLAERISLSKEVKYLSRGFDTVINPDSMAYSKEFVQKIILARAIVGNPKLIVLQDQFLKLDQNCRRAILELIFQEKKETTVIVASNNEELMNYVSKVVVIQQGSISKIGKPLEIVKHLKN